MPAFAFTGLRHRRRRTEHYELTHLGWQGNLKMDAIYKLLAALALVTCALFARPATAVEVLLNGSFEDSAGPFGWTLTQTTASSAPTGDYNANGVVDAADYVVWRDTNINGAQGYTDWKA